MRKHYLHNEFSFKYNLDLKKLKFINYIIKEIEYNYQFKLSKNEVNFFILCFSLISEGSTEEKGNITDYYRKEQKKIYNAVKSLIEMISDKINMGYQVKEKVKHEIFFCIYKILIFKKHINSIEYLVNKFNDVPQEFFEGYNIIYSRITSWNKTINAVKLTKNNIIYITYNILNVLHSNNIKKGVLLLSGPYYLKRYIYNKLNSELGNNLILHLKPNFTYKYDCILTNYQINNSQVPVIQISHQTIQKDLKYIKNVISLYHQ